MERAEGRYKYVETDGETDMHVKSERWRERERPSKERERGIASLDSRFQEPIDQRERPRDPSVLELPESERTSEGSVLACERPPG